MPTVKTNRRRRGRPTSVLSKASHIRLLLFDVDGVLTDGKVLLHADGTESKQFDIRDGTGIVWAHRAGLMTGLLSARQSAATTVRANQLGIRIVHQSALPKLAVYEQIRKDHKLHDEEVAYMGDDVLDLPVLGRVGLSAAPADAAVEVRRRVDWVSSSRGGSGAARELVELVLRAQRRWQPLMRDYISEDPR